MLSLPSFTSSARLLTSTLMLVALAGCATSAPAPTPAPAAPAATAAPTPAPRPTDAPLPTALPSPTAAPPTQPPQPTAAPPTAEPQPTVVAAPATSYLVYSKSDGSLWRADGANTQPINLGDPTEPGATLPWAASPDGRTIAIVTGMGVWGKFAENPRLALWLVGSDGSNPRKVQDLLPPGGIDLTPGGEDAFNLIPALTNQQQLAWSPDGGLVAFVSAHENQVDLYAGTPEGQITRLTDTPRLEQGPRWSPDGGMVAYRTTTSFGTGAGWGQVAIEITRRDGGEPVFVMDDRKLAEGSEAVAIPELFWIGPDVVVAGLADSILGRAEVRTLTISTHTAAGIFNAPYSELAWNEATGQLAIAGTPGNVLDYAIEGRKLSPGVYTWSPGVAQATQIESEPVDTIAWSAQGDALAYSITQKGQHPGVRIWSIGTEGDVRPVAPTPARALAWSLDGQRLAADATVYGRDGKQQAELAGTDTTPAGWGARGLFYFALDASGAAYTLWFWDGATAQQIDTPINRPDSAGVVVPQ